MHKKKVIVGFILVVVFALLLFSSTKSNQTAPILNTNELDYASFVQKVTQKNVGVSEVASINSPELSVPAKTIELNGEQVQVYEFPTVQAVEEQAVKIDSGGFSIDTLVVEWNLPPHFFKSGKLIIFYLGTDAKTLTLLQEILGKQFAGQ